MGFFDLFTSKGGGAKKGGKTSVNIKQRFELLGRSGQGSMSQVWRAYDRDLGRTVCLKLLDKIKTAKFEARFVGKKKPSEGAICAVLNHRNIVKTFEYGRTNAKQDYVVMEWIDGVGLNFLVETKNERLVGQELGILSQLADSLEYLHRERYLHRDLCPRNIMVNTDGVVKLIDFGLTIPYTPDFTAPGNRTGTPDYLAPEVIRRQATDHRVDMFALGVTAFEVLTAGGLPWEKAQGSMEILQKRINSRPKDPRDFKPDLNEDMVRFLNKAVAVDPAKRFQHAAEFKQAVQRLGPDPEAGNEGDAETEG